MDQAQQDPIRGWLGGSAYLSLVASALCPARGRRLDILDAGCGRGGLCRTLAGHGHRVEGIDLSCDNVAEARRITNGPNIAYRQADLCEWRGDRRYDAVVCGYALEHIAEPARALAGLRRLVRPDGIILIAIPNGHGPYEAGAHAAKRLGLARWLRPLFLADRIVRAQLAGTTANYGDNPHLHYFGMDGAVALFRRNGFAVERCQPLGSFLAALQLPPANLVLSWRRAFRLLDRMDGVFSRVLPARWAAGWLFTLRPRREGADR